MISTAGEGSGTWAMCSSERSEMRLRALASIVSTINRGTGSRAPPPRNGTPPAGTCGRFRQAVAVVQWSAADAGATAVSLLLVQCIGDDKVETLWFSSERRLRANHKQQRRKRRNKFPSPRCHSTCPSAWQDHPKTEINFLVDPNRPANRPLKGEREGRRSKVRLP